MTKTIGIHVQIDGPLLEAGVHLATRVPQVSSARHRSWKRDFHAEALRLIAEGRIIFTFARASLIGFAAAGLMAVASTGPALAQTKTYPDDTDCATMQGGEQRLECMHQLGEQQHGSSVFSRDFIIRVAPPDQRGLSPDDGGGGTQTPVVPNNGALAPLNEDDGSAIGTLHW